MMFLFVGILTLWAIVPNWFLYKDIGMAMSFLAAGLMLIMAYFEIK